MALFLLVLSVYQSSFLSQNSNSLAHYQWKNRLIIINANSEDALEQIALFQKYKDDLNERDLILIQLTEKDVYVNSNRTTMDAVVIRKNLAIGKEFECILIGKDGQVKNRSGEITDPAYFFALIDQMPMRQSEMKKPR
jgi:hypothetical protein